MTVAPPDFYNENNAVITTLLHDGYFLQKEGKLSLDSSESRIWSWVTVASLPAQTSLFWFLSMLLNCSPEAGGVQHFPASSSAAAHTVHALLYARWC